MLIALHKFHGYFNNKYGYLSCMFTPSGPGTEEMYIIANNLGATLTIKYGYLSCTFVFSTSGTEQISRMYKMCGVPPRNVED